MEPTKTHPSPSRLGGTLLRRGLSLACAAATVTAMACVHNDGSIYIIGVLQPPASAQGGQCSYTATATGPFNSSGVLDVAFTLHYEPAVLIGNQLAARGDTNQLRVETNRFIAQGTIVRLTDAAGAEIKSYTVQGAGEADPSSGGTPGLGIVFPILVDPDTVINLQKSKLSSPSAAPVRLVAYFKVYGQTTGGQSIESAEFAYPIDACNGCLVTVPAAGCQDTSGGTSATAPCVEGQDQPIDCRLCLKSNPAVCNL